MTATRPAPTAIEHSATRHEVEQISKQLKMLDRLSAIAFPLSAAIGVVALTLLLPGLGTLAALAWATVIGVTRVLRKEKQSEMKVRIKRLAEETKLSPEEASRLLSDVNRFTTGGTSS